VSIARDFPPAADLPEAEKSTTNSRRPLKLVYYEYFESYTEARRREIWLKSGQGREWLKEQMI
jgi:predicted GIY-YIG superfamily endonuclease